MKAFTLPNGSGVLLHELSQADWDALRKWAQKTYIADVSSAIDGMSDAVQYALIREAVEQVTNAAFDLGLCLEILFGSPVGLARVHYQMIQNPGISFNAFFAQVFPHSLYLRTGLDAYAEGFIVLNKMCEAVYGAPIDQVFWSGDTLVKNEEAGEAEVPNEELVEQETPAESEGTPPEPPESLQDVPEQPIEDIQGEGDKDETEPVTESEPVVNEIKDGVVDEKDSEHI